MASYLSLFSLWDGEMVTGFCMSTLIMATPTWKWHQGSRMKVVKRKRPKRVSKSPKPRDSRRSQSLSKSPKPRDSRRSESPSKSPKLRDSRRSKSMSAEIESVLLCLNRAAELLVSSFPITSPDEWLLNFLVKCYLCNDIVCTLVTLVVGRLVFYATLSPGLPVP
uniref:Uncharacterized protein n=1 Tax=Solanum lycopersicum TaxID=4081 RepID=A0A3Q7HJW1_SOLLC